MAMTGLSIYEIDFYILDNNNPKTIVILDQSNYLADPEKPVYSIKLPGHSSGKIIPYTINVINIINSNTLGLTYAPCHDALTDLPDGVYEITQMVCPYDELYKTQYHLKTTKLECSYKKLLLNLDINCKCLPEKQIKEDIMDIEILLNSAKAEVEKGNVIKGTEKYQCASDLITKLNKQLNCK